MAKKEGLQLWIATIILCAVVAVCYLWNIYDKYPAYDIHAEQKLRDEVNQKEIWAISFQQAVRMDGFYQVDKTDTMLYLSYNNSSCVDVYNFDGEFQYAILFPDKQNGAIAIRCINNQVFISDKDNTLHIFEGFNEVRRMTADQAITCGYDFFWFLEKSSYQRVEDGVLYYWDDNIAEETHIILPVLKSNFNFLRVFLLLVSFLIYLVSFAIYLKRNMQ